MDNKDRELIVEALKRISELCSIFDARLSHLEKHVGKIYDELAILHQEPGE